MNHLSKTETGDDARVVGQNRPRSSDHKKSQGVTPSDSIYSSYFLNNRQVSTADLPRFSLRQNDYSEGNHTSGYPLQNTGTIAFPGNENIINPPQRTTMQLFACDYIDPSKQITNLISGSTNGSTPMRNGGIFSEATVDSYGEAAANYGPYRSNTLENGDPYLKNTVENASVFSGTNTASWRDITQNRSSSEDIEEDDDDFRGAVALGNDSSRGEAKAGNGNPIWCATAGSSGLFVENCGKTTMGNAGPYGKATLGKTGAYRKESVGHDAFRKRNKGPWGDAPVANSGLSCGATVRNLSGVVPINNDRSSREVTVGNNGGPCAAATRESGNYPRGNTRQNNGYPTRYSQPRPGEHIIWRQLDQVALHGSNEGRKFCTFCKKNGEPPAVYETHIVRAPDGSVACPVLQRYECQNCGATGPRAHTLSHCPLNSQPRNRGPVFRLKANGAIGLSGYHK